MDIDGKDEKIIIVLLGQTVLLGSQAFSNGWNLTFKVHPLLED